ncbi:DUF6265 family protein [Muriicola sp.]|uniref:DUF6265 family protein n=1 Tax=Muriicola sp. TaxID=2020856 RepID=UPI003C77B814
MKKILLLLPLLFTISCGNNPSESKDGFDWILGNWIRTNETEGAETYENWKKDSSTEYIGFSYTMQHKDTVWQENIRLFKTAETWSFEVTGKGEKEPTKFLLTEIENSNFVCENSTNEFPKKIEYSRNGAQLLAKISGDEMEISFDYKKTDE